MSKPRIYADFMKTIDSERLLLTCNGTFKDLDRLKISLVEGLEATFYMDDGDDAGNPDDLEAEGVVQFDKDLAEWTAVIDWSTLRHASDRAKLNPQNP
jgi:hypothetical protein